MINFYVLIYINDNYAKCDIFIMINYNICHICVCVIMEIEKFKVN